MCIRDSTHTHTDISSCLAYMSEQSQQTCISEDLHSRIDAVLMADRIERGSRRRETDRQTYRELI